MDGYLQARQEVPVESDEMWHLAVCCLLTVFGVKCEVFAWYGMVARGVTRTWTVRTLTPTYQLVSK